MLARGSGGVTRGWALTLRGLLPHRRQLVAGSGRDGAPAPHPNPVGLADDEGLLAEPGIGREEDDAATRGDLVADLVAVQQGEVAVGARRPGVQDLELGVVAIQLAVDTAADPCIGGGHELLAFFVTNEIVWHVLSSLARFNAETITASGV